MVIAMAESIKIDRMELEDLRERAERFQSIFHNSTLGIFQSSIEGRFVMVNTAFATMLGYRDPEDLKESIQDIERQFYRHSACRSEVLAAIKTKEGVHRFETELCRKDGSLITCSMKIRAIRDSNARITHLDGFIEDVTEVRLREKQLLEKAEDLRRENRHLRSLFKGRYRLGKIIGKSDSMQEVYENILQAGGSDTAVIVYGESGTGKELVALAIHELSKRANREFVPVNCAAIPEHLLESEFFGHKKGAFTGAAMDSRGYLDRADGGTLFLDEIGELRLDMQVKLLRAIDGGTYYPVGDSRARKSDFRLISATSRNLGEMVKSGKMREDFFFRIDIIPINLPPLRERREDIPLLVDHCLRECAKGEAPAALPAWVMESLCKYHYPGNVRELQNILLRYLATGKLAFLGSEPEPPDVSEQKGSLPESINSYEKEIIKNRLIENRWHRGRTAASLGIDRKTLYMKIKAFELDIPKRG
jgi:PAS domain S-box-containing protein